MKQLLQSLSSGDTEIVEVPCPVAGRGQLLIDSVRTLVSAGTERMLVNFGKAGLIGKARQQPEKVRMVLEKIRTDGLLPTIEAVRHKLDQPLAMGYCNAGVVREVGEGVSGFSVGDRVASNGRHAEVVAVPATLCAKIPDGVSDEQAAFTVIGAIGLQGVRLAQPTLGEAVVVTGLGLIGLITVQLLRAHGCRVLGLDFDPERVALAREFGAEAVTLAENADPVAVAMAFSRGRGVDAVIITAATDSNEPITHAASMCRKRGRIVLVGVSGLELSRASFYEKELTFQVSCSYGPGRYDPVYEDRGVDYPLGFVRWTAQRNFEAVMDMMSDGRLRVEPLISHRFTIEEALGAYEAMSASGASLGILLEYARQPEAVSRVRTVNVTGSVGADGENNGSSVSVGFIGAGNYASAVLIPAFKAADARLVNVASNTGVSGIHVARKFGFEKTTTDTGSMFSDLGVDALVITTRHNSHASLVSEALAAGKHVYVEKPLAIRRDELQLIAAAYRASAAAARPPVLMVGFNRRFAPHIVKMKALLDAVPGQKSFVMTVNAGAIPLAHWTQAPDIGGGRVVGEACHFVDLLRFLAAAPIERHVASGMRGEAADTVTLTLNFADGSMGTIHYFANGSKSFPKERLEVFTGGKILRLDNFRKLTGYGWQGFNSMGLWRQDKGQRACAKAFVEAIRRGAPSPISFDELLEVALVTLEMSEAACK